MGLIAHLSDVHFGRHDPAIVAALEALLIERQPDLVVISGDFTQRARRAQFRQARIFLDRLRAGGLATLSVPGNHDVPLYDVFRRFMRPLNRYRRYIDDTLCPWFENETLAVLGINTARSLTIKDGRVGHDQMEIIRSRFAQVDPAKARILVTHHPLLQMPLDVEDGDGAPDGHSEAAGRSELALEAIGRAGVHILLAGHFHRSFSGSARDVVERAGPELVIQAGTATSTRLRGDEKQSFNWVHAAPDTVRVNVDSWYGSAFRSGKAAAFAFEGDRWRIAA